MRKRVHILCSFVFLACALAGAVTEAGEIPRLTNADVITFVRAGLAPQLILDRIRAGGNSFDMSTENAIALKEAGVPDDVIAAMLVSAGSDGIPALPTLSPLPTLNPVGGGASQIPPSAFSQINPMGAAGANQPAAGAGARFSNELANIADGSEEARRAAVAWMLANKANTLSPLRETLKDPRPEMLAAALHALGGVGDRDSIPAIRQHVLNPSPVVRRNAAEALVALGDTDAILAAEKSLGQAVAPQDGFIRIIGYARPVRAVGELTRILDSSTVALDRAAAAWALARIGPPAGSAIQAAEKALAGDTDPDVRREAAGAVAAFHNPASAGLLRDACRRDPDVRKIALESMAEYPETLDFLVSVMNLGTDQIAADELEAARQSLHTLTGQDFGLDGARWTAWIAENGGSPVPAAAALPPPPASVPAPASYAADPYAAIPQTNMIATNPSEVDVAQWGIVVNPNDIPMVPEVDGGGRTAAVPPGLEGLAGLLNRYERQNAAAAPAFNPSPAPSVPSASDFGGAAAALPPAPTTSSPWGGASSPFGGSAPAPATASAPYAAPVPSAPAPAPAAALSGVRLPLPPMADSMTSDMQMYAAPSAPAPSGDGFSGIYTPEPANLDTSAYGGSASYEDELHTEDADGTARFVPNDPTLTDPNFIPSDMPMEEYDEYADSGELTMPPPPGGFGMTDDVDVDDSGLSLPPFGGSDDSAAEFDPGEYAFEESAEESVEDNAEEEEEDGFSSLPGSFEDENVRLSGRVGGGDDEEETATQSRAAASSDSGGGMSVITDDSLEAIQEDIEAALGEVPTRVLPPDTPVAAPPARSTSAGSASTSSRPRKGESVWIPGEDDIPSETVVPSAPSSSTGSAEPDDEPAGSADDTSFEIVDGVASEYVTIDELSDVYIQPSAPAITESPESLPLPEAPETLEIPEETEESSASDSAAGLSLPLSGAMEQDPYGDFSSGAAAEMGGEAVDSISESIADSSEALEDAGESLLFNAAAAADAALRENSAASAFDTPLDAITMPPFDAAPPSPASNAPSGMTLTIPPLDMPPSLD